jgi:hypothetical protein
MIKSRETVNKIMSEYYLPAFDLRVSADYGPVSIASSSSSNVEDVLAPQ